MQLGGDESSDGEMNMLRSRGRSVLWASGEMPAEDVSLRTLDRELFTGKKKRRPSSASKKFICDHIGIADSEEVSAVLTTHGDSGVHFIDRTSRLTNHSHMSECVCLISDTRFYILNSRLLPEAENCPFQITSIQKISTSEERDNAIVIHLPNYRSELLMTPYKVELVAVLVQRFREITEKDLEVRFSNVIEFPVSDVALLEVNVVPAAEGVRMTLFCKSAAGNPST
jgi:hypothetical protein